MTEETKICNTCHQDLPRSFFNRREKSPDGLSYACKECQKEMARRSYMRRKKARKMNDIS